MAAIALTMRGLSEGGGVIQLGWVAEADEGTISQPENLCRHCARLTYCAMPASQNLRMFMYFEMQMKEHVLAKLLTLTKKVLH